MKPQDTETLKRLRNKFEIFTYCLKRYWAKQQAPNTSRRASLYKKGRKRSDLSLGDEGSNGMVVRMLMMMIIIIEWNNTNI